MPPDRSARNARILAATLSSAEAAAGATIPQIAASLELDPSLVARVIRNAARNPAPDLPPARSLVDPAAPSSRLADSA